MYKSGIVTSGNTLEHHVLLRHAQHLLPYSSIKVIGATSYMTAVYVIPVGPYYLAITLIRSMLRTTGNYRLRALIYSPKGMYVKIVSPQPETGRLIVSGTHPIMRIPSLKDMCNIAVCLV